MVQIAEEEEDENANGIGDGDNNIRKEFRAVFIYKFRHDSHEKAQLAFGNDSTDEFDIVLKDISETLEEAAREGKDDEQLVRQVQHFFK